MVDDGENDDDDELGLAEGHGLDLRARRAWLRVRVPAKVTALHQHVSGVGACAQGQAAYTKGRLPIAWQQLTAALLPKAEAPTTDRCLLI